MLLLSLVSLYDAYLTNLLKALFEKRPEIIFTSDKQVSFSEISKLNSLDEVKESIVEKEVEGIIRQSHVKQFETLENLFGVTLKTGLDVWPDFVEITEGRNLLAHTNGVVSRQYIVACQNNGVAGDLIPGVGETVTFTSDYFFNTYQVLFEICLKLGHVLWRKTVPSDLRRSDAHYNDVCFNLIKKGQYDLAVKLLDFMCDVVKKYSGQKFGLYMEINRCNAYRLAGKESQWTELLEKIDTSALGLEFRLAEAVLRREYELAGNIMIQIGDNHDVINRFTYSDWPLFEEFREDNFFLKAYQEVFGEAFTVTANVESSE